MSRPYHVYDYEGEHLGSFASWETAHEWAHLQAAMNGVPAPLEVEDRRRSERRRVWADRCEPIRDDSVLPSAPLLDDPALCVVGGTGRPTAITPPRPRQPS